MRKATVAKLFRTPDGHPNALDATAEGFWVGEQVTDRVILMDINGKVLKAFQSECHNCSGLAVGGGHLWLSANGAPQFDRPIKIDNRSQEILQCEMDGKVIKRHTVPLGGGGSTGIEYADGALWMVASRLRVLMRVDASTFQPVVAHPFQLQRPHGLAWDNGAMWVVDGADEARLVKMDAKSGATLEIIELAAGDPDPHGLALLPHTGWLCRVDVV